MTIANVRIITLILFEYFYASTKFMFVIALIIFLFLEVLTFLALKEHYYKTSKTKFFFLLGIHSLLSAWLWLSLIRVVFYKDFFDNPINVRNQMTLAGLIIGVLLPRILLAFLHFTGKLFRIRRGGHIRWLTEAVIIYSAFIFLVVAYGTIHGRFNIKTEEVTISIKDLDPRLEGLKIAQLSDLHLAGFCGHEKHLEYAIEKLNSFRPDLVINTGDFVTFGWREFSRCDTILSKSGSIYGSFAVFGNHDMGVYYPGASDDDKNAIVMKMNELITASGYRVLNDENVMVNIKGVKVAMIGVKTSGSHPYIIYGDLNKATEGIDSADFKILLIHDPNQWDEEVVGKTDIDLSFAGHTHGGQFGILTKKYKWCPVKYFYPRWYGLFTEGKQNLYVNRGLGYLGVPCRVGMPPEITFITLKAD